MFLYDVQPELWELFLTVGVLLIAAIILLSYFISTIIDFAMVFTVLISDNTTSNCLNNFYLRMIFRECFHSIIRTELLPSLGENFMELVK